ncbi:MAG: hypothetical protein EXR50_08435 [Dehalococcoidia bacterium]|nr:hypothetical protein [Dehalococcoidia bacterium]
MMPLAARRDEEQAYYKDGVAVAESVTERPDLLDVIGLALLLYLSLFSLAALLLAALSLFRPLLLVLAGVGISVGVALVVWRVVHAGISAQRLGPALGALGIVAVGAVLFSPPAQFILGGWDAGVYYNTGVALAETGSLTWDDELWDNLSDGGKNVLSDSRPRLYKYLLPGFFVSDSGDIESQLPMLLSIWIGILALFGGQQFALFTPSLLAVLAVFWFYLFGRYLLGSRWALVASLLLSTNAVQIWHSRQTLSEVPLQGMIFGALAAAMFFLRYGSSYAALSAGLTLGMMPVVKTEATFVSIILILFLVAATLSAAKPMSRGLRWSLCGYVFGIMFSAAYYVTVAKMYVFEQLAASRSYMVMGTVLVMFGSALSLSICRRYDLPRLIFTQRTLAFSAFTIFCLIVVSSAGLASENSATANLIGLGAALWNGLFLSSLDGLLLFLGLYFIVMARPNVGRHNRPAAALLFAASIGSLLYLGIFVSYFRAKDDIPLFFWATRRLVPLVLPLLSLLIAFSLCRISQNLKHRGTIFASLAVGLLMFSRIPDTLPVAEHTEYKGAVEQVNQLASSIAKDSVVLFDNDDLGLRLATPFRFLHNLPSYVIWDREDRTVLDAVVDRAGDMGKSVVYVASRPGVSFENTTGHSLDPQLLFHFNLPEWQRTSDSRPNRANSYSTPAYLFKVSKRANQSAAPSSIEIEIGSNNSAEYQLLGGDLFLEEATTSGQRYRWTGHQVRVAVPAVDSGPLALEFTAAGGRPPGVPQSILYVTCGNMGLSAVSLVPDFDRYRAMIPSFCAKEPIMFTIDTWTPRDYRLSADNRALGFMLASVDIKPYPEAGNE